MSLQGDKYTVEELSKDIKARMEAQEQLYAERERHAKTAMQLKIALSKLARQPAPAQPMTDEQFEDWWVTLADYNISGRRMYREQAVKFLKAVEAHHGITAQAGEETIGKSS